MTDKYLTHPTLEEIARPWVVLLFKDVTKTDDRIDGLPVIKLNNKARAANYATRLGNNLRKYPLHLALNKTTYAK